MRAPHCGSKKLQPCATGDADPVQNLEDRLVPAPRTFGHDGNAQRNDVLRIGIENLSRKGCGLVELAAVERRSGILDIRWLRLLHGLDTLKAWRSKHGVLSMAFYAKHTIRARLRIDSVSQP
jgi:hypothetical protein